MIRWTTLEEVADIIAGQSPASEYYNTNGIGFPFFQGKTDFGVVNPIVRIWSTKSLKFAEENDILISVRAPVGPTNICNQKAVIGRGLAAIRIKENHNFKFLFHYLNFIEKEIAAQGKGSTFQAITIPTLRKIKIPLFSLEYQNVVALLLDKAKSIISYRHKSIDVIDTFIRAIFLCYYPYFSPFVFDLLLVFVFISIIICFISNYLYILL